MVAGGLFAQCKSVSNSNARRPGRLPSSQSRRDGRQAPMSLFGCGLASQPLSAPSSYGRLDWPSTRLLWRPVTGCVVFALAQQAIGTGWDRTGCGLLRGGLRRCADVGEKSCVWRSVGVFHADEDAVHVFIQAVARPNVVTSNGLFIPATTR